MNETAYRGLCPKCKGTMECYIKHKPHEIVMGECLSCGFAYYTKAKRLTLKEVNERRNRCGWKILEELKDKGGKK